MDAVQDVPSAEGSAVPEPSAPNIVTLASGHRVTLHPAVTMPIGIAALSVIKQGGSQAIIEAGLAQVYLDLGIVDWTFPDEITPANIARLLPDGGGGLEVAEAADGLYSTEVMRPLLQRLSKSSLTGPKGGSTPPSRSSGSKRQRPSAPSSRNGTAGKPSEVPVP